MADDYLPAIPTVQADDERVRVTEWRIPKGAATGWHRHEMSYVVVPIQGGRLKIATANGDVPAEMVAGQAYSRPVGRRAQRHQRRRPRHRLHRGRGEGVGGTRPDRRNRQEEAMEIPVIDIADLMAAPDSGARERVAGEILRACTGTGFFYLTGHGVGGDLIEEGFEANRRFHARPEAEKLAIKQNRWHRGYQAMASSTLKSSARFEAARHPNQLESFFLRHEVAADDPAYERQPLQGPNQWPDDPGFVDVVRRYDAAMRRLGLDLLPAFSVAVGEAPDFFARHFAPPSTALRLIHYPPASASRPEDLYGIHPHTDYGFLTILAQDRVGGLQIQRVDGSWIDAPTSTAASS